MSDGCQKAYEEWDRKREARKRAEKDEETDVRIMKYLGAAVGLSAGCIIGVAAVMTATAATGVGLPVVITAGLIAVGALAVFIGAAAMGALLMAIWKVIQSMLAASKARKAESDARDALNKANADNPEELARYLGIPGC